MSDRGKKIFLICCVTVPFLLYCFYYYGIMIKNAPYKFSEIELIDLKYGFNENLENGFNSKSGIYTYRNDQDSLIRDTVKLRKDDLLYLHRKAAELGFWNFPENMRGPKPAKMTNVPHYKLSYKYKRKVKTIDFDANYNSNEKLRDAFKQLIDEIIRTVNDAQDRH